MGITSKRTLTKTRRKTRDVDQVKADLASARHLLQFKNTKASEDLPGLGRNYCIECAKWFDTEMALVAHCKGKPHKRRLKQLREEPEPERLPGPVERVSKQPEERSSASKDGFDVQMRS